jgi:hypothetical protein
MMQAPRSTSLVAAIVGDDRSARSRERKWTAVRVLAAYRTPPIGTTMIRTRKTIKT